MRKPRLAAVVITPVLCCALGVGADTALPRSNPSDHQVDPTALAEAFVAAGQLGFVRGMVVARDGYVIGEDHFGSTGAGFRQSRSVTKSVTSILLGIAIEAGYIEEGVSARMVDYLPPELVPDDPAKAEIRLVHLLTMTSGFQWDEDADVVDWLYASEPVREILDRPLVATPGTRWNYNTAASHLLSVVLSEATGMRTLDFADQVLFGPLGITDRHWILTGGYHNGGHGLYLTTESLAKIGILTLSGGAWAGQPVVPAWWITRSTMRDVRNVGSFGPLTAIDYGWLWWLDRGTGYNLYTAWGWGGQFIFCVPALDLVVAVHTNSDVSGSVANQQEAAVLDIIVNRILPATTDRRVFTVTGLEVPELAAVDDMMRGVMAEHDIRNTTVAITKDSRLVYARGFTWDEADIQPIDPTALFRIGSIGKAIASLAIHRLIDDGLLTHGTEVQPILGIEALPGATVDPRFDDVTVDHLLTHTGGMHSQDNIYKVADAVTAATGEDPPPTQTEILSFIMSHPFIFDPGSSWDYNNYGYMMLDRLVDELTDRHFADFVNEEFFRPVGVGRARIAHRLAVEAFPTEVSYDGHEGDPQDPPLEAAIAAGGWVMAAPDLARLWSVIFDEADAGGLLDPATREAMFDAPFPVSQQLGYYRGWYGEELIHGMNVSLGWLSDPDDDFVLRGHGGGGSGIATFAFWHSDNIVFVAFSNKDPIAEDLPFPEIAVWPDHDLWSTVGVSGAAVGSAGTETWIPVVASTDGVGSSVWRSDVGLLNRSEMTNRVRLRLYHENETIDHELELAPAAFTTLPDVMALFERQGSGPLRIFSSEPLGTTSRTYNQAPLGTFGQFLDASSPTRGLAAGDSAVLVQLREDDAFRTNIGLTNGWKRAAKVVIDLVDDDGSPVVSVTRTVPPESTIQLGRPFFELGGRSDISSGYAVVRVIEGQHLQTYASVIDNQTNDPTTIPMKTDAGSQTCWVAAAANVDGAHGSRWRTDVSLLNLSGTAATAELRFRGEESVSTMVVLADGRQQRIEDVVDTLGTNGSGSLEVFADRPLMVGSRTYNVSAAGTFGQYLDGLAATELAAAGETVWLPQLRQDTSFRTNIGLVNAGEIGANVLIRLFDADGNRLAAPRRSLAPYARMQLNEPFRTIAGRSDLEAAYATITVETGGGVIAYASVIDNTTNDPTTIPMSH